MAISWNSGELKVKYMGKKLEKCRVLLSCMGPFSLCQA